MTITTIDKEALERAMKIAQRDPRCAGHLASKLADEPWREVAEFASYLPTAGVEFEAVAIAARQLRRG